MCLESHLPLQRRPGSHPRLIAPATPSVRHCLGPVPVGTRTHSGPLPFSRCVGGCVDFSWVGPEVRRPSVTDPEGSV